MEPPPGIMTIMDATATSVLAEATAAATAIPQNVAEELQGECRLLGPFALIVQAALGGLAMLSLVYKRWRERPQRPVKIWFFDVSKQVFGSVLVHMANVFMSMLTSGRFSVSAEPGPARRLMAREEYVPNPCSWYLLNLAVDTTLGIPILILLLRITTALVSYTPLGKPIESIQSGYYGNPPNVWWWLKQSVIYFFGLFGMKLCVLILFLMFPWISRIGDWALGWTEGNERLQIAFVMMIFPLIMNAMQYYIIDSFIKQKETDHQALPSEDPDRSRRFSVGDSDGDEELLTRSESEDDDSSPKKNNRRVTEEPYDPEVDGEAPTIVGSSSSQVNEPVPNVPRELYPKE